MKDKFKKPIYYYTRAMWYMTQAKSEVFKPLQFWNETIWILTYLAVLNINPKAWMIGVAYLSIFLSMIVLGYVLVKMRFVKYTTQFSSDENPQLMEILERVKRIEEKIK